MKEGDGGLVHHIRNSVICCCSCIRLLDVLYHKKVQFIERYYFYTECNHYKLVLSVKLKCTHHYFSF